MHVIIDARTVTPHFPGIGRYVSNLLDALPGLLQPGEGVTALVTPQTRPLPGAPTFQVNGGPFTLRQQWEVRAALRRSLADIYHSTYFAMPYWPGVPVILTVYDLIPLLYPEAASSRARWLFPYLMRWALRVARHVIAISTATRDDLQRHFHVPASKVSVIPLAPAARFRPQPPAIVEALVARMGLSQPYALYLGSNRPHKNLVRLVEAWALARRMSAAAGRWTLVIAGMWDERYPQARRRVHELDVGGSVRFLGPVAEAALPALYSGADLFIFPSLYEGFGLPVLEAMACGAPVLCSNRPSLPEVAGDAAYLVDPTSVEGMAMAIVSLLGDAARREEMSRRSLGQAAKFSWQRVAQMTLAVYRQVGA
ncbi:MAG: glycosyltransferase family 4 protein [Anaerolineae bacterium]|nr:glycosyltransferase family 4 protein [Anaerolineae bacterium]